ncbi:MAG: DUF1007 family protein [Geminicoccaceae bacterium]
MARLLMVGVLLFASVEAKAHPHAWIDLKSEVQLNPHGEVEAIELYWLFDPFYTAFIAEEVLADGRPPAEVLVEIANTNLTNLRDYDYFTDVRLDDRRLALDDVTHSETGLTEDRLWMRFTVPLTEAVDPDAGQLTFAVYDPTYYIDIRYAEGVFPELTGATSDNCRGTVFEPTPSPEDVAFAYSLGPDESAGDTLGILFAQTTVIGCS